MLFKIVWVTLVFALSMQSQAYTLAETNEVVRSMLERILLSVDDNLDDNDNGEEVEAIVTWPSFLALGESEGWTPPEKTAAFAWYLSILGTNDCTSLSATDHELVTLGNFLIINLRFGQLRISAFPNRVCMSRFWRRSQLACVVFVRRRIN